MKIFSFFCFTALLFVFAAEALSKHPNWRLLHRDGACGQATDFRVVGGRKAFLGQFPWLARIAYSNNPNNQNVSNEEFRCGGAVINERYVLTAAHCGPERTQVHPGYKMSFVRLGEHDVTTDLDCDGFCALPAQDVAIEEHVCHPEYRTENRDNDICLVRLVKPVQFNRFVDPICLPIYDVFQNASFEGRKAEVAGWKWMDNSNEKNSDVLITEKITLVSARECQSAYRNVTNRQLCAGQTGDKHSCITEAGGPLMRPVSVPPAPSRYFMLGLASYRLEHCNQPGVYTKVSEYMRWVLDNIRE